MTHRSILTYAIYAAFLLNIPSSTVVAETSDANAVGFVKGYSWGWVGRRGEYDSPAAAESMRRLAETGCEWVCIAFSTEMSTAENPEFGWGESNEQMVTDDEIRRAIDLARLNNLKVILKPVINVQDGTWRAWIKFYRPITEHEAASGVKGESDPWGSEVVVREGEVKDLKKWTQWWGNFKQFLVHYANIAAEKNVEILCVGCEMNSTEEFEQDWRDAIAKVRQNYAGPITYDINHGRENQLAWWDAVDIMGISAYYPVPPQAGQTLEEAVKQTTPKEEIVAALLDVKAELTAVSKKWNKPILFIETGVSGVRGCARYPWSHPNSHMESPVDEQEQANYYEAFFEVFWGEPWFMGFAWWDWPAQLYDVDEASDIRSFCTYGKKAGKILKRWYAKPSPTVSAWVK